MQLENLIARDVAWSRQITQWADGRRRRAPLWLLARTADSVLWLLLSGVLIWLEIALGGDLLLTVLVTIAVTAVAKAIFRRPRPLAKWAIASDKYAFPSGHAARAGAVAVTLAFAFPAYALLCFLWAPAVALARVALARHYLTDVVVGLLLGAAISLTIQFFM